MFFSSNWERLHDFFCNKSLCDFYCPNKLRDLLGPKRLPDFFLSQDVVWFGFVPRGCMIFSPWKVAWFFWPKKEVAGFCFCPKRWFFCLKRLQVLKFPSSQVPKFLSPQVPNFPSSQVPKFTSSQVLKFPSSQVPALPIPHWGQEWKWRVAQDYTKMCEGNTCSWGCGKCVGERRVATQTGG